jgi:SAM-dependent methyltransferase
MGLVAWHLDLLLRATQLQPLGQVATLGRLEVFMPRSQYQAALRKYRRTTGKDIDLSGFATERILVEVLGAESVTSIDNSPYENATEICDLSQPIPSHLEGQFDTVLDFGTIEHVLNAPAALINVYRMCKDNGLILHASPTNGWVGHGFYQFSPIFFSSFYAHVPTKKFEQRIVEFDFSPFSTGPFKGRAASLAALTRNQRHEFMGPNRSELQTLVVLDNKTQTPNPWYQPDYQEIWGMAQSNVESSKLVPLALTSPSRVRAKINKTLSTALEKFELVRLAYYLSGMARIKVSLANHRRSFNRRNRSFNWT